VRSLLGIVVSGISVPPAEVAAREERRNVAPAGSLTIAACLLLAALLIAGYLTPTAVGQTPRIRRNPSARSC
jgi:hypothetical protein